MPLAFMLIAAAALPQVAPASATWSASGSPGAVTQVIGRVRTGGQIVADRFIPDAAMKREERGAFAGTPAQRGSCAWASAARPFTRLRRFAASGRLLWEWRVDHAQQALRLRATGGGDCLSPNGGRLTVVSYRFAPDEPITPLGDAVVAVDHRARFVAADGVGARATDIVGWRRGAPATLILDVADSDSPATTRETVVR